MEPLKEQEVYVPTENHWQSDFEIGDTHFNVAKGYFHSKEQLIELLEEAIKFGCGMKFSDNSSTFINKIIP